jgi:hypothetical protein
MVANTPPTRFALHPSRADEFIDDLSAVENSLRHVAEKWNTTTGALSLFLASPEGLAIVAAAEIATAVHIRLQAQALLVDVAQSMVYIVREYSREERRIPFNNDLRSIKLGELRRANARRAGNLLLRLALYNPAPIRSYTVRPVAEQSDQPCGMPKRPLGHGYANNDSACGTAVALDSRGLAHETHACAELQACHTNEPSQVSDSVDASSAQTCGMPKRPLGHGEGNSDFARGTAVALDSRGLAHENHACAEPQACHTGETSAPVPPVRRFGATGAVPLTPSAPTPTPTSIQSESASEIVVHVGAANTSLLREPASCIPSLELRALPNDESDSRSPQDCCKAAAGEAALRGAHPHTPFQEHWTLRGSSPLQTSSPLSSDSGP